MIEPTQKIRCANQAHIFGRRHDRKCDCGERTWPTNTTPFVIPPGESWAMLPELGTIWGGSNQDRDPAKRLT